LYAHLSSLSHNVKSAVTPATALSILAHIF
jgi:hypothetical protein